jgi:type IV secretory pathway TrbF-like protein
MATAAPAVSSRLAEQLALRAAYEDRHSQFKVRVTNAYRIAGAAALIAILEAVALIRAAGRDHIQPYVAVLDKNATLLNLATPVRSAVSLDDIVRIDQMKRWLTEARTVTADTRVQRAFVVDVMGKTEGAAKVKMREYYTRLQPFRLAETQTVSATVGTPIPNDASASSYRVSWTESIVDNASGQETKKKYEGIFTFAVQPSESVTPATTNPVGFYIVNFNWSEQS